MYVLAVNIFNFHGIIHVTMRGRYGNINLVSILSAVQRNRGINH
jgi:hypothetical protein